MASLASVNQQVRASVTVDWSAGRYQALQQACETGATHIHYVDFDRLLRWVETRPQEWRQVVARLQTCECLVIGRTPAAYQTHPQALVRTEAISNLVTSALVGMSVDASAGSKAFSRPAARCILANTQPGHALGTDAEWLVVLHKAGFKLDYIEVDGLDWEIADQHQGQAAGPDRQRQVAAAYDADPQHWARRVEVALEIVQAGFAADARIPKIGGK